MANLPAPEYLNLEYWFNQFIEFMALVPGWVVRFLDWLAQFHLKFVSIIVSALLAIGIITLIYKIIELQKKKIVSYIDFFAEEQAPETRSARWSEIKAHLAGDNPIEWKMAIIEADALLDEILKGIGYKGETLAERLKSVKPSDFDNLQDVWEAHKLRNRLVHEPGKVELSGRAAKIAIGKYEKALKELKYI